MIFFLTVNINQNHIIIYKKRFFFPLLLETSHYLQSFYFLRVGLEVFDGKSCGDEELKLPFNVLFGAMCKSKFR